jgi:phospholipase A1
MTPHRLLGLALAVGQVLAGLPAQAQTTLKLPAATGVAREVDCPAISDDRQRLACFDRAAGRDRLQPSTAPSREALTPTAPTPAAPTLAPAAESPSDRPTAPPLSNPPQLVLPPDLAAPVDAMPTPGLESLLPAGAGPLARAVLDVRRSLGTSLADRWELEPSSDRGRFLLRPYKPMYAMIADWTSNKNETPQSPNPANVVDERLALRRGEAKFQLSLKTKVVEDMIGDNGDLWLGYTQTSYWQIYNSAESRPFRESNYEPEIMAVFRTNYSLLGWDGKLAGLSLNHQSNGRSEPLSRSWNRLILQFGLENKNWMMMVRPWWRIPESSRTDDNADIEDYMGRADLLLVRKSEGHELSLLARHSLRSGSRSRGSLQVDYAFPITSYLKAYAQVFSGYGASLIDYNHRQTRIGIGISLIQWL